ncbi:hypothetical protein OHA27_34310 [Streptomyces sp. NBC_01619]|uniref:hypothetical protein n=1 Tax=Streptomyces sp. NBC_01619 TaxID=2975901 RepID=UPI00225791C9|nr:hypothetical protein [Streptomyces sp. NBC_01619]MCX4515306.1 hypothetical protein [Streptomyces sp. NBC_01619]
MWIWLTWSKRTDSLRCIASSKAGTTLPPGPANAWRSASAGRMCVGAFAREFFLQHVRRTLALAVRASDSDVLGALSPRRRARSPRSSACTRCWAAW